MQSYIVALVIDPSKQDETTRASCEIDAPDGVDAERQAQKWAADLAVEGDWLVITHNGRSIRAIEMKSSD